MSWQDQGRQEHGWFGNGTAAGHTDAGDGRLIGPDGLGQRITAVAYGAIASLRARRGHGPRDSWTRSRCRD